MKHLRYWPLFAFAILAACSPEQQPSSPMPQEEAATIREEASAPPAGEVVEPDMAPQPASCADELGADQARILVDQCLAISTATRPPCNAQNSCEMIRDEIRRGCGFGDGADNPEFCSEYQ